MLRHRVAWWFPAKMGLIFRQIVWFFSLLMKQAAKCYQSNNIPCYILEAQEDLNNSTGVMDKYFLPAFQPFLFICQYTKALFSFYLFLFCLICFFTCKLVNAM